MEARISVFHRYWSPPPTHTHIPQSRSQLWLEGFICILLPRPCQALPGPALGELLCFPHRQEHAGTLLL